MTLRRMRTLGREVEVDAAFADGTVTVTSGGQHHAFEAAELGRGVEWLLRDAAGRSHHVTALRRGETWWIHADGRTHVFDAAPRTPSPAAATGDLTAPMTGLVADVLVAKGARVIAGQPLVVISAMKMQVEVRSPIAGVVRSIAVRRGEQVEGGTIVAVVTPEAVR